LGGGPWTNSLRTTRIPGNGFYSRKRVRRRPLKTGPRAAVRLHAASASDERLEPRPSFKEGGGRPFSRISLAGRGARKVARKRNVANLFGRAVFR
jgi:hypothetical protein